MTRGGNIGVLLGAASDNLTTIDIDDDAMVAPFLELNPFLANTLRTRGARGCQFWLRTRGPYPERIYKVRDHNGLMVAEWRGGGGAQSVIFGVHPNGNTYRFDYELPPTNCN